MEPNYNGIMSEEGKTSLSFDISHVIVPNIFSEIWPKTENQAVSIVVCPY